MATKHVYVHVAPSSLLLIFISSRYSKLYRETEALTRRQLKYWTVKFWAPIILIHFADRLKLPGRRKELVTQLMAGGGSHASEQPNRRASTPLARPDGR